MSVATPSSPPEVSVDAAEYQKRREFYRTMHETDCVWIIVTQQFPGLQWPGRYLTPLGVALEQVRRGFAKIDPASAKTFEAFKKTIETKERAMGEKAAADAEKLAKEMKGGPVESVYRLRDEQFQKTHGHGF